MKRFLAAALIIPLAAGCVSAPRKKAETPAKPSKSGSRGFFIPAEPGAVRFSDSHDKKGLLKALRYNIQYLREAKKNRIYDIAGRKVDTAVLLESSLAFMEIIEKHPRRTDERIKEKFDIYMLSGRDGEGTVIFSSYYEPTIDASLEKTPSYPYPIYSWPDDLIEADLEEFIPELKGRKIRGRAENGKLVPYYSREEIDYGGAIEGKAKKLAWFRDQIDVMNLHIQGSGRLKLPGGAEMRAKYAVTNGLPFKGWISYMIEKGIMPRKGLTYEKAKNFFLSHPELQKEILCSNPRYTFFELEEIKDPTDGPQGTYKYPLTAKRSIAVDDSIIPLGTVSYIKLRLPELDENSDYKGTREDERFVLCQDTGGAIKGPGRVDFFAGSGDEAHIFANKVWEKGKHYVLILKEKYLRGNEP